jgi:hypothetical protein
LTIDLDQGAPSARAQEQHRIFRGHEGMTGEAMYLGLVVSAFLILAGAIAYVSVLERRR